MELARWISPLASPRAVAGACAANSIAVAVPCHRVVGSNGDLTGYRWGIERKRQLTDPEGSDEMSTRPFRMSSASAVSSAEARVTAYDSASSAASRYMVAVTVAPLGQM
jgi:O-6-methylguanine DNA methyltransferase